MLIQPMGNAQLQIAHIKKELEPADLASTCRVQSNHLPCMYRSAPLFLFRIFAVCKPYTKAKPPTSSRSNLNWGARECRSSSVSEARTSREAARACRGPSCWRHQPLSSDRNEDFQEEGGGSPIPVPNSSYLVFPAKGGMEPQMEFQGSPPSPVPFLRGWGERGPRQGVGFLRLSRN